MTNIPTELLRTFVAVVDMRSFTRAAQSLGITQPAVSAQVKRLQQLLDGDLMDKSAPGVLLTPMGESVLGYARRLLAINDHILNLAAVPAASVGHTIRVGIPGDFVGNTLWRILARSRESRPDIHFHVKSSPSEILVREVRQGQLDVAVTVSGADPHDDARFHWTEDMVWVRAPLTRIDPGVPVPLVSHGDKCLAHRQVVDALERAGRAYNLSFTETSVTSLTAAVGAGLGVMALPRCVSHGGDLAVWDDAPLPPLPAIVCNVSVRSGADDVVDQFAQALADAYAAGRASRSHE
jgi:DNA-binding transcriptional LysR family regulator